MKDITNKHRYVVLSVFLFFAIILTPWTIYLSRNLPSNYITRNWDVVWIGIDAMIIIGFLLIAILGYLKSKWLVIAVASSATLIILDAWLDITSSWHTPDFNQSVVLAVFFELPTAIMMCVYIHFLITKHLS